MLQGGDSGVGHPPRGGLGHRSTAVGGPDSRKRGVFSLSYFVRFLS